MTDEERIGGDEEKPDLDCSREDAILDAEEQAPPVPPVPTTEPDDRDALLQKLGVLLAENALLVEWKEQVEAAQATEAAKPKTSVSRDEMALCLASLKQGQAADFTGSVARKHGGVDGEVFAQFNRPEVDGHAHKYVIVPERFVLDAFLPAED